MRILCIRGGGLGDLIVTLPTLELLRRQWPDAHLELLGHPRLAEIAVGRFYLDAVRSVNHGPLSTFFMPRAVLDPDWMDYMGSFDLVLSYFYDPDTLFQANLQRCEPGQIITFSPRLPADFGRPAAHYFAQMVEPLDLHLKDPWSRLAVTDEDRQAAASFLSGMAADTRLVALHPGSGSETKNWPVASWAGLGCQLSADDPRVTLLVVEGEADGPRVEALLEAWKGVSLLRARWLPLPILAALLQRAALFVGHDSGVTHLAAAADEELPIVALFGPSDPAIWAPPRPGVEVLHPPFRAGFVKCARGAESRPRRVRPRWKASCVVRAGPAWNG